MRFSIDKVSNKYLWVYFKNCCSDSNRFKSPRLFPFSPSHRNESARDLLARSPLRWSDLCCLDEVQVALFPGRDAFPQSRRVFQSVSSLSASFWTPPFEDWLACRLCQWAVLTRADALSLSSMILRLELWIRKKINSTDFTSFVVCMTRVFPHIINWNDEESETRLIPLYSVAYNGTFIHEKIKSDKSGEERER